MNWLELLPELLDGWGMTLRLLAVAMPLGLLLGALIGTVRVYGPWPLRAAAGLYQSVLRGVPLVVQLFVLYYALPRTGLLLTPFAAAILGFGMCSGAYHSEYIRSAISSIPRGQMEAARAVGMSRGQAVRAIILPQALRRAVPGCGSELVYLVKYSSLAYLVTLVDLMGAGRIEANASFRFFETFLVVGTIYLVMVSILRAALHVLQRAWRRSSVGLGA